MAETLTVTFKIQRFTPETDAAPHLESYTLEGMAETDRVLDALNRIKWEQDGSLAYRRSCAHGVCGSDGMRINGRNMLACSVLLRDVNPKRTITIEPMPALRVIKDLVVDMDSFFEKYEAVKPYLINKTPPPEQERLQSQDDAEKLFESAKCILCGCCSTSCPSLWSNENYLAPAAMLKAYRFIHDTRDEAADDRLDILDTPDGIWRCHGIFNCVEACPKDIDITWHLSELKKDLVKRSY